MSRPHSKLVLLAVLFAAAPLALPAHAADVPTDLEAAARRAFEEERYAEAQALYERAARTGADPVAAWFDAGNCAFRRGAFAEAAVAYRRVLAAAPRDDQARFHLALTERRLGLDPAAPSPGAALVEALDRSPPTPLWIASVLAAFAGWWLVLRTAHPGARALGAALVLAATALPVQRIATTLAPPREEAVVLEDRVPLRPEPHDESPSFRDLRAGETVQIAESSDRWTRIVAPAAGWLPRASLAPITDPVSSAPR